MMKKSGSRPYRLPSKEEIRAGAEEGVFDRNPLLTKPHEFMCKGCGCRQKIVYLDYLKSGRFELGKTEIVEVAHAAPTLTGLGRAFERMTPLFIRIKCKRCGTETSYSPISLEYLLFTIRKKERSENVYI